MLTHRIHNNASRKGEDVNAKNRCHTATRWAYSANAQVMLIKKGE